MGRILDRPMLALALGLASVFGFVFSFVFVAVVVVLLFIILVVVVVVATVVVVVVAVLVAVLLIIAVVVIIVFIGIVDLVGLLAHAGRPWHHVLEDTVEAIPAHCGVLRREAAVAPLALTHDLRQLPLRHRLLLRHGRCRLGLGGRGAAQRLRRRSAPVTLGIQSGHSLQLRELRHRLRRCAANGHSADGRAVPTQGGGSDEERGSQGRCRQDGRAHLNVRHATPGRGARRGGAVR
mmetsp:Transcript_113784/g.368160  ORF Transcript_113784/g.368160 Transcript_113784/m.368160 type:complete len:236 (+) Transcript_113784:985-1692(+)